MLLMENYKTTVKPSGKLVTTKLDSDRLIKDFPNIVSKIRQAMAIPNQAAYLSMMDAYDKIKRTKFFKGAVKKELNLAVEAYRKFEQALHYGTWNNRDFFDPAPPTAEEVAKGYKQVTRDDVWDYYELIGAMAYKRYHKPIEMLRMQVLQCFTREQLEYREELSHICTANCIIEYSTCIFDRLMNEYKRSYGADLTHIFSTFRMTAVTHHFKKASYLLGKTTSQNRNINLNDEKNVRLAFEVLETQMMRDLVNSKSAIEAALEEPDLFPPEQIKQLKKLYEIIKDK